MKRLMMVAAAVAVTACNTPPKELGTLQLCERYLWGSSNRAALADEVKQRGLNCDQYAEQIQKERAAKELKREQALQGIAASQAIMNANRPAPIPMPQRMNCRSRNVYGTIYTDCN